jgi:hypothetical protein
MLTKPLPEGSFKRHRAIALGHEPLLLKEK